MKLKVTKERITLPNTVHIQNNVLRSAKIIAIHEHSRAYGATASTKKKTIRFLIRLIFNTVLSTSLN